MVCRGMPIAKIEASFRANQASSSSRNANRVPGLWKGNREWIPRREIFAWRILLPPEIMRMYLHLARGHDARTLRMIPNIAVELGPSVGPSKVVELRQAV